MSCPDETLLKAEVECSMALIRQSDYAEFKRMCALPGTYEAWLNGLKATLASSAGVEYHRIATIEVSPSEFREYLTETGKAASAHQLVYYATNIVSDAPASHASQS
jgi:hypothetical protein